MSDVNRVLAAADAGMSASLDRLFSLLRIPSLSADPAFDKDCRRAGQWLVDGFRRRLSACPSHSDLLAMLDEPADRSFHPAHPVEPRLAPDVPLFTAENLHVHYKTPDGKTRHALDGLSLMIRHGETIGVAGRSGCHSMSRHMISVKPPHSGQGTSKTRWSLAA